MLLQVMDQKLKKHDHYRSRLVRITAVANLLQNLFQSWIFPKKSLYIRHAFVFHLYLFFCNFKLALCLLALCLCLLPELYSSQSSYYNYLLGGNFLVVKRSITHLPQSVLRAHSWCLVSHSNCLS